MKYSKELVERYKNCMREDYDYEVISDEEAEMHLSSLGRLFILFSDIDSKK